MTRSFWLAPLLALGALLSTTPARADVPPFCGQFNSDPSCDPSCAGKPCADGKTCYAISCQQPTEVLYKCRTCPQVIEDPEGICAKTGFPPPNGSPPCGDGGICTRIPEWCKSGYYVCAKGESPPPAGEVCTGGGAAGSGQAGAAGSGQAGAAGSGQAGAAGSGQAGAAGSGQAGTGTTATGGGNPGASGSATAGTAGSAGSTESGDSSCAVPRGVSQQGAMAGLMLALGAAALLSERRRR